MKGLTKAQAGVLRFIVTFRTANEYPPTCAEVARNFGYASDNAAHEHLMALERKGYIAITRRTARGIRVIREAA